MASSLPRRIVKVRALCWLHCVVLLRGAFSMADDVGLVYSLRSCVCDCRRRSVCWRSQVSDESEPELGILQD